MKPYEKLQRYWLNTRARISTAPLDEQEVVGLERKYSLRLQNDFRDYVLHCCRENDGVWDDNLTTWWSLDRIKSVVDEYEHKISDETIARDAPKYLFFADYSIWCWAWAIACGDDENRGRVVVISGRDRFVADSFAQFVDRYIDGCFQLV